MGFYALRGTASVYDWMNISGGIFMDVFPETAIAWALGAIKTGDLFGNLFSVMNNPDSVTQSQPQPVHTQTTTNKQYPPFRNPPVAPNPQMTLHQLVNKDKGRHSK